jgi:creatinine amidohydrolase/Fe(II)-dependent formamide hydrolase-like protein
LCYSKGEKVTIKAHGGPIDIEGIVVAEVNDKLQLRSIEVFFDPMLMFRQMAPDGETGVTKVKADE